MPHTRNDGQGFPPNRRPGIPSIQLISDKNHHQARRHSPVRDSIICVAMRRVKSLPRPILASLRLALLGLSTHFAAFLLNSAMSFRGTPWADEESAYLQLGRPFASLRVTVGWQSSPLPSQRERARVRDPFLHTPSYMRESAKPKPYRPVNTEGRFSKNAWTASLWSSVFRTCFWATWAKSRASSKSMDRLLCTRCLINVNDWVAPLASREASSS